MSPDRPSNFGQQVVVHHGIPKDLQVRLDDIDRAAMRERDGAGRADGAAWLDRHQLLDHLDALTAEAEAVCRAWLAQDDKGLDGAMADLCATLGLDA